MWMSWRAAADQALYAEHGFYRRSGRLARHFRTSVHVSPRFAAAVFQLFPEAPEIVDIGAGHGEFLTAVNGGARLVGVELAPRPEELPERIEWVPALPRDIEGLVVANEWLSNIPVDVVELTPSGPKLVMVDKSGAERLGDVPCPEDLAWLDRWWPLRSLGQRAEIGRPRDEAWRDLVRRVRRGVVVAADCSHTLADRPSFGTLTGHRDGREVIPVPDGSCDITAHVALDSCAASVDVSTTVLTTQRDALRALGIRGARPDIGMARTDPRGYVCTLQRAGEEAELIDSDGLGGFGWLIHGIGIALPAEIIDSAASKPT